MSIKQFSTEVATTSVEVMLVVGFGSGEATHKFLEDSSVERHHTQVPNNVLKL